MSLVSFKHKGNFEKTSKFLQRAQKREFYSNLDKYGEMGVQALQSATPMDTGETARSWHYKIEKGKDSVTIYWYNTNVNEGANIVLLLYYGHGTHFGDYVRGKKFIKPAMKPVFKEIEDGVWGEVTKK